MNEIFMVIVSVVMLIVVVKYFVLTNIKLVSKYYYLKRHGKLCRAKIVDYQKENDSDSITFYFPLIQFFTENGKIIEGKLSIGKPKYDLRNTEDVLVYSDPINPENCIEKSYEPLVFGWISITVSVIACLLIVGYMYMNMKKYFI